MQKLTLGDKIAGKLSCLSDHYVHRKLLPLECRGCEWTDMCHKIMLVIKKNV